MTMEFVFARPEEVDSKNLHQGDLLLKTPELKAAIAEAHAYYAEEDDYSHFMVLTQSCDLVLRGGTPKSRYITLAAVRPFKLVVERQTEKYRYRDFNFPIQLCEKNKQLLANQFLERLLHFTEDGYFLIRKESTPNITDDLCAFLPLSIALRSPAHYEVCIRSKIAQLDHIFAAKIGWLTGNLYSRVATPDVEEKIADAEEYKSAFGEEVLHGYTAWLTSIQFRELKKKVSLWRKANPGVDLTVAVATELLRTVPQDLEIVAERAVSVLRDSGLLPKDSETLQRARTSLQSDTNLQRLIRTLSA
jgi:hypothetical protein